MISHLYFYNADAEPRWGDEAPPPLDTMSIARRRSVADAVTEAIPDCRDTGFPQTYVDCWIELNAPGMEIFVHSDHVHIQLRTGELRAHCGSCLTRRLHSLAHVLERVAGYDFFEHGCQGLGRRADIDAVAHVLVVP